MSVEHLGLRTAPQSQNSTLVWVEGSLNLVHSSPFHGQGQSHVVPNPIQPCPDPDLTPPLCLSFPLWEMGRTSPLPSLGLISVPDACLNSGCQFRMVFGVTGVVF